MSLNRVNRSAATLTKKQNRGFDYSYIRNVRYLC